MFVNPIFSERDPLLQRWWADFLTLDVCVCNLIPRGEVVRGASTHVKELVQKSF